MKALVIYDSVFGNTEKVAQAIGNALGTQEAVGVARVGEVKPEQLRGLDLLLLGSPTRSFRPTPAIGQFLQAIPAGGLHGVRVGAFDTRIAQADIKQGILRFMVNIGGYAAKRIAGDLQKRGGTLIASPEGFFVAGEQGPLKDGELERAAEWGRARRG
jgi:flavodoxin